jgi:diguanylate cyclase (GGDEF)-like protein
VILLEEIEGLQDTIHMTERLFAELRVPQTIEGCEVLATASIGIVLGNRNYREPAHLLRDADSAMYRAKASGRDKYEIFDGEMHAQAIERTR